jgi:hypothetical protein
MEEDFEKMSLKELRDYGNSLGLEIKKVILY